MNMDMKEELTFGALLFVLFCYFWYFIVSKNRC